jgi:hypothetical protein
MELTSFCTPTLDDTKRSLVDGCWLLLCLGMLDSHGMLHHTCVARAPLLPIRDQTPQHIVCSSLSSYQYPRQWRHQKPSDKPVPNWAGPCCSQPAHFTSTSYSHCPPRQTSKTGQAGLCQFDHFLWVTHTLSLLKLISVNSQRSTRLSLSLWPLKLEPVLVNCTQ